MTSRKESYTYTSYYIDDIVSIFIKYIDGEDSLEIDDENYIRDMEELYQASDSEEQPPSSLSIMHLFIFIV